MSIAPLLQMEDTKSCAAYRRILDDIVADEVDAVNLASAEAHLAICEDCRVALAQALAYRRMMSRVGGEMRAPNSLRDRVLDLIRARRGSQPK